MSRYAVPSFIDPDAPDRPSFDDVFGIDEYDYRQDRLNELTGHPRGIDADAAEAAFNRSIDQGLRRMEHLLGPEWTEEMRLQEKAMGVDPLPNRHGSPELDTDAAKLRAMGQDPGPTLQDLGMGPDHSKHGIFAYHRCWKCDDGARPCVNGSPNRCDYPRARNE